MADTPSANQSTAFQCSLRDNYKVTCIQTLGGLFLGLLVPRAGRYGFSTGDNAGISPNADFAVPLGGPMRS